MNAPVPSAEASLAVLPVLGLPEVRPGDDLAEHLVRALCPAGTTPARPGDVLCVSSKLISKAEGLIVPAEERERAVAEATVRTVARRRHGTVVTRVVECVSGPVMAGAGIDASNSPDGLLLLPEDPDAAALALCVALRERLGIDLGVILTDTSSRIWRTGVTDIALGCAGVMAQQDLRGGTDDAGRSLAVTVRALADELAAAADLVKGKTARIPAAIVRGLPDVVGPAPVSGSSDPGAPAGARSLVRTGEDDWFRRPSLESVWQALGVPLTDEPVAAMSPEPDAQRIARALEVAAMARASPADTAESEAPAAPPLVLDPEQTPEGLRIRVVPQGSEERSWIAAGMVAERVRTALAAEDIARALPPIAVLIGGPDTREMR